MALKFTLNKADFSGLVNVMHGTPSGTTYDHVALSGTPGGTVTLAGGREADARELLKHIESSKAAGHQNYLVES